MHDKNKLKILMAVPQYPFPVVGGLERQSHELSKQLATYGADVKVISGMIAVNSSHMESVEGVQVTRVPWGENKALRFLGGWWDIAKAMYRMRNEYDVVHLHNISWFGAVVILVSKLLRKPVLAKLPNVAEHGIPGMLHRRMGRMLVSIFKLSDAVVAMSQQSVDELRQIDYPDSRIFRMTNGVSTPSFAPLSGEKKADPSAPLNAIFCGRLDVQKGLADLLSVWPGVLTNTGRSCVLRVYGTGPLEPELNRLISELHLKDRVKLMGYESRIAEALRQSDLFVLPSYAEGNSNAILEAMAAGLPIVSTRVGGTPLLVGRAGRDYLIEPGDRDGLRDILAELLRDDQKRSGLGKLMLNRINSHFRMEVVAQRYMMAYRCLVEQRGKGIAAISAPVFGSHEET